MARSSDSPVTYLLRDPKSKKPTPVNCIIRFTNQRINVGTGFKVLPSHWNTAKQRVKNVVDALDKDELNSFFDSLEVFVDNTITDLKVERQLTKEAVRQRVDTYLKPAQDKEELGIPKEPELFSFIADFIERAPKRINPDTGKPVEYRTIQRYQTALNGLRAFAETYPRKVDFDTIDLNFYEAFTSWLTFTKGYTKNNVGKYIQMLKTFLNEATAKGVKVKQDYRSRSFKVVNEVADAVYLSEDELSQLLALDLRLNERLERVRDLFICPCPVR